MKKMFSIQFLFVFALVSLVFPLSSGAAEWGEWITDAEIVYSSSNNINNAVINRAKEKEAIITPSLSLGRVNQLTDFTRVILSADISGASHSEFSRLNYNTFGLTTGIRSKLGVGPNHPWLGADLSVSRINSESKLRSGNKYLLNLSFSKRLGSRTDFVLGYTYDNRNSDDPEPLNADFPGAVYDLEGHAASANLNLLVTQKALLSLGYSFRRGGIASTCKPDFIPWDVVEAIAKDDAMPGCAYNLDADVNTWSSNLNYALFDGHASMYVGYDYIDGRARADGSVNYKTNIWRIGIVYLL